MANELRIGLLELLRKAQMDRDADFPKEGMRVLSQALMELKVEEHTGAGFHERTTECTGHQQRLPKEELGHPGRHDAARRAHLGERLKLLTVAVGSEKASGASACGGCAGSVCARGFHLQDGRPPGEVPWDGRRQQEPGGQGLRGVALREARRGGGVVSAQAS
jgi:hypothetical protein